MSSLSRRHHASLFARPATRCIASVALTVTTLMTAVSVDKARAAGTGLTVDLNSESDRKDAEARLALNWSVPAGESASQTLGNITITLRGVGAPLQTAMWKGGFDTAPLATDGVVLRSDNAADHIEITLTGLKTGRHTLTTYHNSTDNDGMPAVVALYAADGDASAKVLARPSVRILSDQDTPTAHIEFDTRDDGSAVIILARGDNSTQPIVLSGLTIDGSDPRRRATHPLPAWGDMHADVETAVLRWRSPRVSHSFNVYLGTDKNAVEQATPSSPEFVGNVTSDAIDVARSLSNHHVYYWRVDTLDAQDVATPSPVWSFRPRHLAFPGAEGYGRFAIGGRGGKVYHVTSLDDAGPGTLRHAVEAEGPRTVVFEVGGAIHLKSKLVIRNPYITIAGQTAPGDGIAVYGHTFGHIGSHDSIIRYIRIRPGDVNLATDGTGFPNTDHAIMDHCSISWTRDEAVSSRRGRNITFQRNIVAEALNPRGHGFAGSISGNIGSFHHNLVAHCAGRNWSLAGGYAQSADAFDGYLDIRNNVVYNWVHRTTDGGVRYLNFVGNYYIPGPASRPNVRHLVIARIENRLSQDTQRFHIAGNKMEGQPEYETDNWSQGGVRYDAKDLAAIRLLEPFCPSFITERTADEAYDSVMGDVGANLPHHDEVDRRVISDVKNRTFTLRGSRNNLPGIIDSQTDAGGYPAMKAGPAPADIDRDGMADWWETARRLDPADPEDRNADRDEDGYTNLEEYLNWIVSNGGLEQKR